MYFCKSIVYLKTVWFNILTCSDVNWYSRIQMPYSHIGLGFHYQMFCAGIVQCQKLKAVSLSGLSN